MNIHGLFDELMYNLACDPPKVFALPEDVRSHFKDGKSSGFFCACGFVSLDGFLVTASASGAYMESGDVVRERLRLVSFFWYTGPILNDLCCALTQSTWIR